MLKYQTIVPLINENLWSFVSFLISAALAIIAVHYGRKSYRQDKALAARRPQLNICCYGAGRLGKTLFELPFGQSNLITVPLIFDVTNSGQLAATNVELYLDLPDAIYGRDIPRELSRIAEARGQIHAAQEGRNEHMTTALMSLKDIAPGETCRVIPEIMFTMATKLPWAVKAPTRDGKAVSMKGVVHYAWTGQAKVSCTEHAPTVISLSIEARSGQVNDAAAVLQEETNDALRKWGTGGPSPPPQFTVVSFSAFKDTQATTTDGKRIRVKEALAASVVVLSSRLA